MFRAVYFPDLPTSLKTLLNRLDDYLQVYPMLPEIGNPVLAGENLRRHWTDNQYVSFRNQIHKYREWIDDAYDERDEAASIEKWRRILGDEFAANVKVELVDAETIAPFDFNPKRFRDSVDAVNNLGMAILTQARSSLPWVKPVPWYPASEEEDRVEVTIRATSYATRRGAPMSKIKSGVPLPTGIENLFEAVSSTGIKFSSSSEFDVQWRVVNTDIEAFDANALRGGFYPSQEPGCRWEPTQYRGVHWVEAFIVRKSDCICVGRSERFYVVVE